MICCLIKILKSIIDHPDDVYEGSYKPSYEGSYIEFNVKKSTMILNYIAIEDEDEELKEKLKVKIKLSRDEFINNLVTIFYYQLYLNIKTLGNDKKMKSFSVMVITIIYYKHNKKVGFYLYKQVYQILKYCLLL